MRVLLAALLLASATTNAPADGPPFVRGYSRASLVTLGVAPAVAADTAALRHTAMAACATLRPCTARIWVGRGQRFRTMSTAEVRSLVASFVIGADGRARFVCGPAGTAARTCSALATQVGPVAARRVS